MRARTLCAGNVPVLMDSDHAGGHEIDFLQSTANFLRAYGDLPARPIGDLLIETGAENDTVANSTHDPESLGTLGGNVEWHRTLAGPKPHVAAGAFVACRYIDTAVMEQIAYEAESFFEHDEFGRGAPQTVNRTVSRAHADDRTPLRNFVEGGERVGSDCRVTIHHIGYGRAQTNSLRIDRA